MTGRTHDLAAFSLVSYALIAYTPLEVSLATLIVSFGVVFLGGLFPDLDNISSDFWKKIPGGSLVGRLLSPLLGGHRMISHSLLGFVITGFLLDLFLSAANSILLVDMQVVWVVFMLGYLSHLIADALTIEGIPLFFPLPLNVGFPPFESLRIKTGGKIEKYLVYPGLMLLVGYMYISNYSQLLDFFQNHIH